MRHYLWGLAALVLIAAGPATAGDIVFKPIDTNKYVVKPTRAAADLTSQTINLAGTTAAESIKSNGYVKTINNLFSKKIIVPHTQAGPSPLPAPTMFPSTQYKNYNTPAMPIMQPVRRR
jgi:hypothetical protein